MKAPGAAELRAVDLGLPLVWTRSKIVRGSILKEHPTLEAEDITEALQYAAEAVRERMIPLEA